MHRNIARVVLLGLVLQGALARAQEPQSPRFLQPVPPAKELELREEATRQLALKPQRATRWRVSVLDGMELRRRIVPLLNANVTSTQPPPVKVEFEVFPGVRIPAEIRSADQRPSGDISMFGSLPKAGGETFVVRVSSTGMCSGFIIAMVDGERRTYRISPMRSSPYHIVEQFDSRSFIPVERDDVITRSQLIEGGIELKKREKAQREQPQ